MAKDLDTGWFDLKNYSNLQTLDSNGWKTQIDYRYDTHIMFEILAQPECEIHHDYASQFLNYRINEIKCRPIREKNNKIQDLKKILISNQKVKAHIESSDKNFTPIVDNLSNECLSKQELISLIEKYNSEFEVYRNTFIDSNNKHDANLVEVNNALTLVNEVIDLNQNVLSEFLFSNFRFENALKYPFNTRSVYSADAEHIRAVATNKKYDDIWELTDSSLARLVSNTRDLESEVLIKTPIDLLMAERGDDNKLKNVIIDLSHTNEQILIDFKHWLTEYKKFTDTEIIEKNFSNKDFSDWIKYGVLQYIDLTFVSRFENKKLTQANIANLIWPDELKVNITDRLRRETIPIAKFLLNSSTLAAIVGQNVA